MWSTTVSISGSQYTETVKESKHERKGSEIHETVKASQPRDKTLDVTEIII
jgi:hypothetical protein